MKSRTGYAGFPSGLPREGSGPVLVLNPVCVYESPLYIPREHPHKLSY
jgi:hypothetical protein